MAVPEDKDPKNHFNMAVKTTYLVTLKVLIILSCFGILFWKIYEKNVQLEILSSKIRKLGNDNTEHEKLRITRSVDPPYRRRPILSMCQFN